jgi:argininosuccinate lyase
MTGLMLANIEIKNDLLKDEKYQYLFSVEEVNKLVLQGVPFRDAYKKIGQDIEAGNFQYSQNISHSHEGSIGNLQNEQIRRMMDELLPLFNFSSLKRVLDKLLH